MAGQREWIVRYGRPVLLRTAPIDPNDPMRGDYARLDFEIAHVPRAQWSNGLKVKFAANRHDYRAGRDLRVYAALAVDDAGVAGLTALSDEPPAHGLFLAGRVSSYDGARLHVRYGIEALFMQQGKAQQLEDARRRDRPGVPLDAKVAVSGSGVAVLQGCEWEPLGVTATFERSPAPPLPGAVPPNAARLPPPRQVVSAVKLELKNYGPGEVAIVDLPAGGALQLVPDWRMPESRYRWVGEGRARPKPAADHIIVLQPGQTHTIRLDLTRPEWFVTDTKAPPAGQQPLPLHDVANPWEATFRVAYAPPSKADCAGLPHAELIRHGRLLSRAFNPTTGMD
jgi:uncharacterized membrane-anchored protein